MGKEGAFADFTYQDTNGKLTEILTTHGFICDVETWLESPPIYHLEVKSTSGPCKEPFHMSNNQVTMVSFSNVLGSGNYENADTFQARKHTVSWGSGRIPTDVYIVLRVYNLEKETDPGFTAYVDPWAMYMNWELSFMARDDFVVAT
jgi:hypothetical protein